MNVQALQRIGIKSLVNQIPDERLEEAGQILSSLAVSQICIELNDR